MNELIIEHNMMQGDAIGLLRTIGIIILIYYGFKLFSKYVFPWLLRYGMKKAQQKMEEKMKNQFGQQFKQQYNNTSDQDIKVNQNTTINKKQPTSSHKKDDDYGEYVDFEEIK